MNCLGYALEINDWIRVPISYGDSVETVYSRVASKVSNDYGRRCRRMNAKDDYLRSNEYKIAMRVGSRKKIDQTSGLPIEYMDYHFMVQVNTSDWAHKRGSGSSQFLGHIDPSSYDWGSLYGYDGFYDSPTLYFAVTR